MLRTRIITALILAAFLFAAVLSLESRHWAWVVAVIAGLGGWEFGRLSGWRAASPVVGVWIFGIAAAATWLVPAMAGQAAFGESALVLPILAVAAAFWVGVVPFWLRRRWPVGPAGGLIVATLVLIPTWLAIVQLHRLHPWLLIAAMAFVSFADIAAYFSGRRFGRRKLAPEISPGKTWEGVYGAFAATTVFGLLVAVSIGWIDSPLRLVALLLLMPALTLISVAGDLFESMLKRRAGMKDSSQLLPGHGGILDRIDSLTAALPIAALALLLIP